MALSGERLEPRLEGRFAGVGLLRGEYVFRRAGRYPTAESVGELLVPYLREVVDQAAGQPVWYRFTEVTTIEANVLTGVEAILDDEAFPLLGMRGIRRAQRFPEHFRAEIDGVAAVGGAGVLMPFSPIRRRSSGRSLRYATGHPGLRSDPWSKPPRPYCNWTA